MAVRPCASEALSFGKPVKKPKDTNKNQRHSTTPLAA